MEVTAVHEQKNNNIIERPNRCYHPKSRIAMDLVNDLPIEACVVRESTSFIKHNTWHSSTKSRPCYKWHRRPFNYNYVQIF